jgi:hypothetical protein
VPVQARRVQVVFSSDLVARLARRQPPINFGAFEVLTGAALSSHRIPLPHFQTFVRHAPSRGGTDERTVGIAPQRAQVIDFEFNLRNLRILDSAGRRSS